MAGTASPIPSPTQWGKGTLGSLSPPPPPPLRMTVPPPPPRPRPPPAVSFQLAPGCFRAGLHACLGRDPLIQARAAGVWALEGQV